jgi:hypothetical protein
MTCGDIRRTVRHLDDIVDGKLFRQRSVGGKLYHLSSGHELCLAWNGAGREQRQPPAASLMGRCQSGSNVIDIDILA